ncbi:putative ATPase [Thermocatellispora tengchongensis]|uniref:Putative ATPase n=1 Tax=Thermocatellispora tengchongensis TaxID=1073253 RepID=A0A840PRV6_9ACTN|nr:AAA family ATPase [Thermocatellispora tengchongensis]MBB5138695.1 putative ATPase [Thermocatellispora tengchongensis]
MERSYLPAEVTSFVGRRAELAEIKRLLGVSRLVTLTGLGGVGKSRLALRAARAVRRSFPGGVHLVDLSDLEDPELLGHTVCQALGLPDRTARTPLEVLIEHLRDQRALLLLDGVDHLVSPCAPLVDALLRAAPRLRVLVTSRQVLDVPGEHLLVVPPLPVPGPDEPASAARHESVALFVERAAAAVAGFELTERNREAVARLCARLDGIPLALELAAVRLHAMSVEQILDRLDGRFRLLVGGGPTRPPRHQTLRTAMGWSHELCTPEERLLWARLSVFTGSFDLDAAESVCADERLPAAAILDGVAGLVEKSIVMREDSDGGVRYRLLDTVREYGAEWLLLLDPEGAAELRARHVRHFTAFATACEAAWFGPDQERIFARTRAEHRNLRAALEFCVTRPGHARDGMGLAAILWFYWVGCGYLGEGRHWLDQALALDPAPSPERARALWACGYVAGVQGDIAYATRLLEECREIGDPRVAARAVHRLACTAFLDDELERAVPLFEEALKRYARLDDGAPPRGTGPPEPFGDVGGHAAVARVELAMVTAFLGRRARSAELCREARAMCERRGERWVRAHLDYVESYWAWASGDPVRAIGLARASLAAHHAFHDVIGVVMAVELIALLVTEGAAVPSAYDQAAVLQGAAARLWQSVGMPSFGSRYFNEPHQECARRARAAIGERRYTAMLARGGRLGLDATVSRALSDESELVGVGHLDPGAAVKYALSDDTVNP